jgi:hypothetical protein
MTDHYDTACRLGASPSKAKLYERYMLIVAKHEGIRPMPCKTFLDHLNRRKPIRIVGRLSPSAAIEPDSSE